MHSQRIGLDELIVGNQIENYDIVEIETILDIISFIGLQVITLYLAMKENNYLSYCHFRSLNYYLLSTFDPKLLIVSFNLVHKHAFIATFSLANQISCNHSLENAIFFSR